MDLLSQLFNVNIGHLHPEIVAAIVEQAQKMCTIAPSFANDAGSEADRLIAELAPGHLNKVFFTKQGTDSIENVVRMAPITVTSTTLMSLRAKEDRHVPGQEYSTQPRGPQHGPVPSPPWRIQHDQEQHAAEPAPVEGQHQPQSGDEHGEDSPEPPRARCEGQDHQAGCLRRPKRKLPRGLIVHGPVSTRRGG